MKSYTQIIILLLSSGLVATMPALAQIPQDGSVVTGAFNGLDIPPEPSMSNQWLIYQILMM